MSKFVISTIYTMLTNVFLQEEHFGRQRFDEEKLQNLKVRSIFVLHLKNKFQALADLEDYTQSDQEEVKINWEQVTTAYLQTSTALLGTRERKKEWITATPRQAINTRRDLKKQFIEAKYERRNERHKQQYQRQTGR